jgi:hypothetical protein
VLPQRPRNDAAHFVSREAAMTWRFRQSFRIAPGIRLNLSKTGVSLSLGGAPFTVNLSRKGLMGTASLPGSGLSASKRVAFADARSAQEKPEMNEPQALPAGDLSSPSAEPKTYGAFGVLAFFAFMFGIIALGIFQSRQPPAATPKPAAALSQPEPAPAPAQAAYHIGDYVVGPKGAVYCKNTDDLEAQLITAMAGLKGTPAPGCGVLAPGTKIAGAKIIHDAKFNGCLGEVKGEVVAVVTIPDASDFVRSPSSDESGDDVAAELAAPTNIVRLSGVDLSAETRKWFGKVVQTKASCFYADVDEFRCVSSNFRIDLAEIKPASARAKLERECDTIAKSARGVCTVTLRFKYADYSRMENGGLNGRTTMVRAAGNVAYVSK